MTTDVRVLVFGLTRSVTTDEILRLLGARGPVRLDLVPVPGDNDAAFAVLHVAPDRELAGQLARGLNTRQLHGRRLQSWVPAMAWT
jgi:hypothetical protein